MASRKHNERRIFVDLIDRNRTLDNIAWTGEKISERIAVLLDENEKLRRIASDLSTHNRRMRGSEAESN